jgi:nucleoside-diphosphate-sugar epimerase
MSILLPGAAGFIGFQLLERGERVLGIDNLNAYYDVRLKEARLSELRRFPNFSFTTLDVADRDRSSRFSISIAPCVASPISRRRRASGIPW